MRITCDGRMRRFSGRARRMEAETKREQVGTTIRTFLPGDVTAVMEILRSSPEAAQWTEWGFWELLGWGGVLALVSEGDKKMIGFIIGRQVRDEAEILNLAVMKPIIFLSPSLTSARTPPHPSNSQKPH